MSKIIVSACLIVYNQRQYVKDCIEGAINQNLNMPYEVVIGDDCSNDGTSEMCEHYASKYPKLIKYHRREHNLGMNGNWKQTIEDCNGKYIALCEGDDYWTDSYKLQKQVNFIENETDFSGVFHDTMFLDETSGKDEVKLWRLYDKTIFDLKDTISKTSLFHTSSFMFRKSNIYIPDWFFKIKSCDMALFALVASKGKLKRIENTMSVYRRHDGGVTSSINLLSYHKSRIYLFNSLRPHLGDSVSSEIDAVLKFHQKELEEIEKRGKVVNKVIRYLKKMING